MRKLTKHELVEIQELTRIAAAETLKAYHFAENTARLNVDKGTRGATLALQQKLVAQLMEELKDRHVAGKLIQLGYPQDAKCSIDLTTGAIRVMT